MLRIRKEHGDVKEEYAYLKEMVFEIKYYKKPTEVNLSYILELTRYVKISKECFGG